MQNNEPLVSVLMTAYNREKYIAEAIESVLASTFKNFELIILDDGSKDDTVAICKEYEAKDERIKVFQNEKNIGQFQTRNKIVTYAKGKYIKYLDSDDTIYPYGLGVFVDGMEKFPEAAFGLCSAYDGRMPFPACITPAEIYWEHFNGFAHLYRAPGSSIIRRDIFELENGFVTNLVAGDSEFWARLALRYKMVKVPRDLYWCRAHPGQITNLFFSQHLDSGYGAIKKYLFSDQCPLTKGQVRIVKKKLFRRKIKGEAVNFFNRFFK
ncbi:glycosyltransferase family 2 protein [Ferruginibacter albus]|uniref:glycosyltransferase family 2 protein n=1 Tax=Ferruginibacter albus TaxID=2875540 RepID=UPI001CC46976|nr:glycosyltransferase family 2 protein [Ferruginibacter albus]UAY50686.1 glycosyltransferase [Ferruginibacter albus]